MVLFDLFWSDIHQRRCFWLNWKFIVVLSVRAKKKIIIFNKHFFFNLFIMIINISNRPSYAEWLKGTEKSGSQSWSMLNQKQKCRMFNNYYLFIIIIKPNVALILLPHIWRAVAAIWFLFMVFTLHLVSMHKSSTLKITLECF